MPCYRPHYENCPCRACEEERVYCLECDEPFTQVNTGYADEDFQGEKGNEEQCCDSCAFGDCPVCGDPIDGEDAIYVGNNRFVCWTGCLEQGFPLLALVAKLSD